MFQFKVVLVGDSRVGKTAFLKRFTESYFTTDMHPTIGVDLRMHDFTVDNKTVKLEVRMRILFFSHPPAAVALSAGRRAPNVVAA